MQANLCIEKFWIEKAFMVSLTVDINYFFLQQYKHASGWVGGGMGVKAILMIAYSNK